MKEGYKRQNKEECDDDPTIQDKIDECSIWKRKKKQDDHKRKKLIF